jgi:hypothetical protein
MSAEDFLLALGWTHRRWRQRFQALLAHHAATRQAPPDAVALRDLGIDPSEWVSVQSEAAGLAAATRRRVTP